MASTRTKSLARAIQQANPGMKYTEALRRAESGGILIGSSPGPWDGETHPDLLTFLIGQNLDTGEPQFLTLPSNPQHILVCGRAMAGRRSIADLIAAQVLIKPMPWDRDLHGTVVMVDPTGRLTRRWSGRPGVVVANGLQESGLDVMVSAMEWVEAERQRRATVLAKHPDAGSWVDLPDEVKSKERFAPLLVVLDDQLVQTDPQYGRGNEHLKMSRAQEKITRLATQHVRTYRSFGMFTMLLTQSPVPLFGKDLMQNLLVRILMGQGDSLSMNAMFESQDVPELPAAQASERGGNGRPIVGRVRVEPGRDVDMFQVPSFGGRANSQTLDKWLPRGGTTLRGSISAPMPAPGVDLQSATPASPPTTVVPGVAGGKPRKRPAPRQR